MKTNSLFFKYQKEDLLLTDDKGTQWVVLSKYADTERSNLASDKLMCGIWLYGYFVTDEQLTILKEYASKRNLLIVILLQFQKPILYIVANIHGQVVVNQY